MSDLGARLGRLPADTLAALAFFSRIPVDAPAASFDLHRSAGAWPIAGLLLALGPAAIFLLARAADMPALVAALLALAALAALTGAMHEDGLADTADGLGGGRTPDDKLAIMRDSRLGTFGALALMFTLFIKVGALASIGLHPWCGALALLSAAVLSRSMALWHWNSTMPARQDGMAWAAGRPDWMSMAVGLLAGLVAAVALLVAFGLAGLIAILLAAVGTMLLSGLCGRRIGGHTGDTVGAAQQVSEALILAGLTAGSGIMVL